MVPIAVNRWCCGVKVAGSGSGKDLWVALRSRRVCRGAMVTLPEFFRFRSGHAAVAAARCGADVQNIGKGQKSNFQKTLTLLT